MPKSLLTQAQWTGLPRWQLVALTPTDFIVKVAGASKYKSKAVIRNRRIHLLTYLNERGNTVAYVLQVKKKLMVPVVEGSFFVFLPFGDKTKVTKDAFADDHVRLLSLGSNYLFIVKRTPKKVDKDLL